MPGVMPLLIVEDQEMPMTWDEIIPFYQRLEAEEWWRKSLCSMEELVRLIIENRDVSALYMWTSHENLGLAKHDPYEEWKGKASLLITPASAVNYRFTLSVPLEDLPIYREKSESVMCPLEYALQVYDEMIEKMDGINSAKAGEA
jgi:hypothetical protein